MLLGSKSKRLQIKCRRKMHVGGNFTDKKFKEYKMRDDTCLLCLKLAASMEC